MSWICCHLYNSALFRSLYVCDVVLCIMNNYVWLRGKEYDLLHYMLSIQDLVDPELEDVPVADGHTSKAHIVTREQVC